jgi:rhamnose utilization protein RhaD (predicted bifunctional aldolase and dehydrogenase)
MSCANLTALAAMSNQYGSNPEFVLAGGGNTSFKDEKTLYVKGSGTSLATIQPEDFVVMDRAALAVIRTKKYSEDTTVREAEVLADMMDARCKGQTRRPSVETTLHDLLDWKFVLHHFQYIFAFYQNLFFLPFLWCLFLNS